MAHRSINRLSAALVDKLIKHGDPGRYADGGNLYLYISPNGGRRWTFLFRWHGKPTEIGLGSARDVPLKRAREIAADNRAKLAEGVKPHGLRRASGGSTFGEIADRLLETMRPSWRSEKHAKDWERTIKEDAAVLRRLPVASITTEDILTVLKPIWLTKHETATRLRGRIEEVLDAAKAQGLRTGENPARWRGHLKQLLPKQQRIEKRHLAAMRYSDVPAFMAQLRNQPDMPFRALEFAILCASRTDEVLGATWDEINLDAALWTISGPRMKGGKTHTVPLSARAVEILKVLPHASEYVFPGRSLHSPRAPATLFRALASMEACDVTVHGFRSSFRDWAGDCTNFPRDVVEAALAHAIENKVEAAYRRGTAIEKRRKLMQSWADYCRKPAATGSVTPLRAVSG